MENVDRRVMCVGGAHLVLVWNARWLPLETAYPGVLDVRRGKGERLGQAMMLQGHECQVGNAECGLRSLRPLLRASADLAAERHVDTLFLLVNPERIERWMRMGFKSTGWGVREWDFANYAPVAPLEFDVSNWIPF